MIELGPATLLLALRPLVLHAAGLAAPLVWAIGSGAVATGLFLLLVLSGSTS